ncbi:MAG: tripartite tricarboxylate transporter substrate binding protein [Betaproteobacteria bacterium]|nr:MAG: tripartite tricarboxylate transporter substrate binding protein [Betaproteobacteria bacterium]TMG78676.1 MAG: tripartite tricarboxylate transporter substrate binding protein [Betaproteobacteria bacterium]
MKILIEMCAAFCVASATQVHAQDYPRGPINLVIPLAPGDATDTSARAIADELSRELKVAIVPVNRPGAGGALGTGQVVKSKPDGYTIILTNNASLVFRSILDPETASYNPLTDLTPLGLAMRSPSILAVRGEAPYKTFREMVEHAKKNPGSVRVGTAGAGSVGDFCLRTINSATGAGLTMVPFTGASPAVTALLGGHVEGVILALGTMTGHLRSGTLRGIVISSKYPDFSDIPTLAELGYSEPFFGVWVGFFAPAGVPAEVIRALVPALEQAIRSPAIGTKLRPLGMLMDYSPPDKLLAEIRDEHARVHEIAQKSGLIK